MHGYSIIWCKLKTRHRLHSKSKDVISMKIEKVNDHQIRCTLTKTDLADRELKISELAYGTEKAKSLFRDMMQQAAFEFGFEAEDIPLMIEAIPLNSDCIVLVITKVEDPEELDTRFSKFAPSVHSEKDSQESIIQPSKSGADDVLDLFKKLHDNKTKESNSAKKLPSEKKSTAQLPSANVAITKFYSFPSLASFTRVSKVLSGLYEGENSLYKDAANSSYKLVIKKGAQAPEDFNKVCNVLSEYGKSEQYSNAGEAYFSEHFSLIVKDSAIQDFSKI